MAVSQEFWDRGYDLIEDLIDPGHIAMVATAMETQSRNGAMTKANNWRVTSAEEQYSPVPAAMLLKHCRPAIEALVGRDLLEGYAYWRTYYHGAVLREHTDRAACEISATVAIGCEPEGASWLFHVEDLDGQKVAIAIEPGAAVIYQGHKVKHWREPLGGQSHKQMFLHYVLKDGDYADHIFDKMGEDPIVSRRL